MRFILLLLTLFLPQGPAVPGHTGAIGGGGGGSAPSLDGTTCTGQTFSAASQTCVFNNNLVSGRGIQMVYFAGSGGTPTISGCGITWTTDTGSHNINTATGIAASSAACTVTITAASGTPSMGVVGAEIQNTSGVDVRSGSNVSVISATATVAFNCPAVTTTVNNDLVFCLLSDANGNNGTYTAGTGFTLGSVTAGFKTAFETETLASAGAVTPQAIYSLNAVGAMATSTIAWKP